VTTLLCNDGFSDVSKPAYSLW